MPRPERASLLLMVLADADWLIIFGSSGSPSIQGIEDRTVQPFATWTMRDHLRENALDMLQVFNPLPDVSNVLFGDALDFGACHASATREPEKRTNLVEGKTQVPRSPDEDYSLLVLLCKKPVSASGASRLRQYADAFVVADRFDGHSTFRRKRANGEVEGRFHVRFSPGCSTTPRHTLSFKRIIVRLARIKRVWLSCEGNGHAYSASCRAVLRKQTEIGGISPRHPASVEDDR